MTIEKNLDWVDFWQRQWGWWVVIETGEKYKLKKIIIKPEEYLSKQYHDHRSETWVIVKGEGKVIIDEKITLLKVGDYFHVPAKAVHQIFNTSKEKDLIAIEVQVGDTTSEYDIVRL